MRKVHRSSAAILLASAMLVAACGNGSGTGTTKATSPSTTPPPAEPAQGTSDPCDLVTSTEAEKAIGAPVAAPKRGTVRQTNGWTRRECAYRNPGKNGSITIATYTEPGGITSAEFNKAVLRQSPNASGAQKVDGVGDEAFEVTVPLNKVVTFRKGSKMAAVGMQVVVTAGQGSSRVQDAQRRLEERLLELSRLAASRL